VAAFARKRDAPDKFVRHLHRQLRFAAFGPRRAVVRFHIDRRRTFDDQVLNTCGGRTAAYRDPRSGYDLKSLRVRTNLCADAADDRTEADEKYRNTNC